jgi:hypothetical protein
MHLVFRLTHKPNMLDKLPSNMAYCQRIDSLQVAFDIASFAAVDGHASAQPVSSIGRLDKTFESMAAVRAVGSRDSQLFVQRTCEEYKF